MAANNKWTGLGSLLESKEIKLLESFNINVEDRMYISFNSHIVTPFHKMIDKFSESKSKNKKFKNKKNKNKNK